MWDEEVESNNVKGREDGGVGRERRGRSRRGSRRWRVEF